MQNPTPQLKVFIISLCDMFLFFNHLNILLILILDRSIFIENLSGIDLDRFSISPPPVIWAAEFINPLSTNFKISLSIFLLALLNPFEFFEIWRFLIKDLTSEYPFEWIPLDGIAI